MSIKPLFVGTASGKLIRIDEEPINPASYSLDDICYGLSNVKRYTGQMDWSTLQHTRLVYNIACIYNEVNDEKVDEIELRRLAIAHDFREALANDLSSRVISQIGRLAAPGKNPYLEYEEMAQESINVKLGLSPLKDIDPKLVRALKWCDFGAAIVEMSINMPEVLSERTHRIASGMIKMGVLEIEGETIDMFHSPIEDQIAIADMSALIWSHFDKRLLLQNLDDEADFARNVLPSYIAREHQDTEAYCEILGLFNPNLMNLTLDGQSDNNISL